MGCSVWGIPGLAFQEFQGLGFGALRDFGLALCIEILQSTPSLKTLFKGCGSRTLPPNKGGTKP